MAMYDDGLGYSTHTSNPGYPDGASGYAEAPGSSGPANGSMAVHHGVITIILVSSLALVAIGVAFRKPIGSSR